MPNALSNNERLAYGKEAVWGTTPVAVGASSFLRYKSVNSQNEKTTVESEEITTSAEVADIVQVSQRGGLSFGAELSYGNLDDILESIFANTWAANVLTVGVTRKPLTLERQFSDIGRYWTYKGALCSQLALNLAIGRILDGTCTFNAKPLVEGAASAFTGGGTLAAPTNAVMDPITSLQLAQEGGAGSIAGLSECSLSIARPVVDLPQVGSVDPLDLLNGQLVVSGSFSCYYADATYITKHLAHTTSSLSVTLGGAANLKYNFLMSKVKLMVPNIGNGGVNQPLIQKIEFKAFKDAANGTLKITRTP